MFDIRLIIYFIYRPSELKFSDRNIPTRAPFPPSVFPSMDESKRPEEKSDYQEAIDDVERAQVAKRWTRAMVKYGVEARGLAYAP